MHLLDVAFLEVCHRPERAHVHPLGDRAVCNHPDRSLILQAHSMLRKGVDVELRRGNETDRLEEESPRRRILHLRAPERREGGEVVGSGGGFEDGRQAGWVPPSRRAKGGGRECGVELTMERRRVGW